MIFALICCMDFFFQFNTGTSTVYVHFTEDESGRRALEEKAIPYDMEEMNKIVTESANALVTKEHSRDLQTFFKYSMSCVFVDSSFVVSMKLNDIFYFG